MRASEVLALLPASNIAERDALLLGLAEQGEIVAEWADLTIGDLKIRVLRDALKWGEPGDAVRLGVTPRTQQQIADLLGAVLLTPKLSDACARAAADAGGLVRPHTQPINSTTDGYAKLSSAIDADLPTSYGGIVSGFKDWCVSADVFTKKGYATNYGWHIPKDKAKAWSPIPVEKLVASVSDPGLLVVQGPYEAHDTGKDLDGDGDTDTGHADYSQLVRVVHRVAHWKGRAVDLADVYTGKIGPEAAACVSHEGALADWRLPGVDALVPPVKHGAASEPPRPSVPPVVIAEAPISTRPTIKRGSKGPAVADWQRVIGVTADGDFGPNTESKTKTWQAARGLTADGIVGPKTWAAADSEGRMKTLPPADNGGIKFVAARYYRKVPDGRVIDLVVLHTAEVAETLTSAEAVAGFFSNPGTYPSGKPRQVSAHYCVDADSIVQCVPDRDVAFAAPGANANGIQIELSGFARQTSVDWGDDFSRKTLARAAGLVARILRENSIPCAYVDWVTLKRGGARGITTHDDVSKAWRQSDHTDPGKGFPMTAFVEAVRALI